MTTRNERNQGIITEFRSNSGKVGGNFEGAPMLLLSTKGAKTGLGRINPLMYLPDGDRWIVFASKGGAPKSPDWFHNLVANPAVTLEVGTESFEAESAVVTGEERDQLYARQAELYPQFGEYQTKTSRTIPVVALTRRRSP
jgi:deazaflavin-dependent oxidoreductase (nitroreductase family)